MTCCIDGDHRESSLHFLSKHQESHRVCFSTNPSYTRTPRALHNHHTPRSHHLDPSTRSNVRGGDLHTAAACLTPALFSHSPLPSCPSTLDVSPRRCSISSIARSRQEEEFGTKWGTSVKSRLAKHKENTSKNSTCGIRCDKENNKKRTKQQRCHEVADATHILRSHPASRTRAVFQSVVQFCMN